MDDADNLKYICEIIKCGAKGNIHKRNIEYIFDYCKSINTSNCIYVTGLIHSLKENYNEAIKLYEIAVELGNSHAMCGLAHNLEYGLNGIESNFEKTMSLYNQAANLENASAMNHLALIYEIGDDVDQNYENAIRLYKKRDTFRWC